jgi:lysozyme family protein
MDEKSKRGLVALMVALVVLLGIGLVVANVGDSGNDSSVESGSGDDGDHDDSDGDDGGPQYTPEQIGKFQEALASTGCYTGEVDGLYGPETDAGIRAFQAAKGLVVDGIPGEQTLTALLEAVANGETDVCGVVTVNLTTSDGLATTLDVKTCSFVGEQGLQLEAENETNKLTVAAEDNAGTISLASADGDREGSVESVEVGDHGEFVATGMLTLASDGAEPADFELTGTCQ